MINNIRPILCNKNVQNYAKLMVPTVAIGAAFSKAYKFDEKRDQINNLSNNLSTNFISVGLQSLGKGLFVVSSTLATIVRTFDERTKYDKACSVVQDLTWIAGGMIGKALLNQKYLKIGATKSTDIGKFYQFFYDLCTFTIGTNIIAPKLNKFVRKIFVDPFVERNPHSRFGKENEVNSYDNFELVSDRLKEVENSKSPLPISMDKYNLARLANAKPHK